MWKLGSGGVGCCAHGLCLGTSRTGGPVTWWQADPGQQLRLDGEAFQHPGAGDDMGLLLAPCSCAGRKATPWRRYMRVLGACNGAPVVHQVRHYLYAPFLRCHRRHRGGSGKKADVRNDRWRGGAPGRRRHRFRRPQLVSLPRDSNSVTHQGVSGAGGQPSYEHAFRHGITFIRRPQR